MQFMEGFAEQELRALEASGYAPEIDEEERLRGKLTIKVIAEIRGIKRELQIHYPDLFPYFRPEVFCDGLDFAKRHYDVHSGIVCLLERGTRNWQPDWTAAKLLDEKLNKWEQVCNGSPAIGYEEYDDGQAEPVSVYCDKESFMAILVDTSWQIPKEEMKGRFCLALPPLAKGKTRGHRLSGIVTSVSGKDCGQIAICASQWEKWHKQNGFLVKEYRWLRLQEPPTFRTATQALIYIKEHDLNRYNRIIETLRRRKCGFFGFIFPEEIRKGELGENWLFLYFDGRLKGSRDKSDDGLRLLKAEPAGPVDMFERVPELSALQDKTVAVIGLGCVGAPSVLSLARSGVRRLRILDCDDVSPSTTCRWPLGMQYVTSPKMMGLSGFLGANYPFTEVLFDFLPTLQKGKVLGSVNLGEVKGHYDQVALVDRFLDGVDLIYDASSEDGITHMLSDYAKERQIPLVIASSSLGGHGGEVLRILPEEETGCFVCYYLWRRDGKIPRPPQNVNAAIQPVGCGDVTFHASDFDVGEIALAGVRMAASILCKNMSGGYPWNKDDVGILGMRHDGFSVFPQWEGFSLPPHPECGCCR